MCTTMCLCACVTGTINATVHREVIKEYATYFHAGTVIVLRQASTHSLLVFMLYLICTLSKLLNPLLTFENFN